MYISGGFTRRYLSRVFTRSITTKSADATARPIPMNATYSRTRYRSMMCVESRDQEPEPHDAEDHVRRPDRHAGRNAHAQRRALERGHHQVIRDEDREAAHQGDAPAPTVRADRQRKRDQPEDQRGQRQGVALVALDLERRAAVRVVPVLGDL